MTDERAPEGAPTPSADPPPPAPSWDAPTTATPPPPLAAYIPPPIAPPAAPQPAVAWQTPAPASVARGGRSGLALAAGILLLVLGGLGLLFGLLFVGVAGLVGGLSGSGTFDGIPGMPPGMEGAIGGFVAVIGVIIILYSVLYLIGGIGVLRTRSWGRVIGIVVGIISGLIWLLGIVSPGTSGSDGTSGILFALVLFLVHLFIVVVLAIRWRSRIAVA